MYYIYRHIRLDKNEPFYIGKGKSKTRNGKMYPCDEYYRAYCKRNRNKYWSNIVSKSEYKIEIIFESDNEFDINNKEMEMIKLYGRKDLGLGTLCNLTDGGEKEIGKIFTDEYRLKLSIASKGRIKSESTRLKLSNSLKGKIKTEEHRKKLSKSKLGFRHTEESKQKMSKSRTGQKRSDEFKQKQRLNQTGRIYSEESKKKMSESQKGKYNEYNHPSSRKLINTDTKEIYPSIKLVCMLFDYKYDTIHRKLNGKLKNNTPFEYYYDEF